MPVQSSLFATLCPEVNLESYSMMLVPLTLVTAVDHLRN